jgi:hypothetical protein
MSDDMNVIELTTQCFDRGPVSRDTVKTSGVSVVVD